MKSIHFSESIPKIAAEFSTGKCFIHLFSDLVEAETFTGFLVELKKYIRSNRIFKNRSLSILLDNSSTHRAKDLLSNLKENFNTLIFIPPYIPSTLLSSISLSSWKVALKLAVKESLSILEVEKVRRWSRHGPQGWDLRVSLDDLRIDLE